MLYIPGTVLASRDTLMKKKQPNKQKTKTSDFPDEVDVLEQGSPTSGPQAVDRYGSRSVRNQAAQQERGLHIMCSVISKPSPIPCP